MKVSFFKRKNLFVPRPLTLNILCAFVAKQDMTYVK